MPGDITALFLQLRGGDREVIDDLFPIVYDELRTIAHRQLGRERSGHTFSTTALVHEAYLRLVDHPLASWEDRAHFCAVAARAMRQILVDYARRRQALKRGGSMRPLPLDESRIVVEEQAALVVSLDEALDRLSRMNERVGRVVELRFFGGLTEEEAAEVLGVSTRTIRRDWSKAKVWLYKELYPDAAQSSPEAS